MFKMKAKIKTLPFEKFFRKTAINQIRGQSEKVQKPENVPMQTFSQCEQSTHGTTCLNMPSKHQTSIASKTELTTQTGVWVVIFSYVNSYDFN